MLVRTTNPFGKQLGNSNCIFEWPGSLDAVDPKWIHQLTGSFKGSLEYRVDERRVRMTIPHAQIDAFGGIYFARDLIASSPVAAFDHHGIYDSHFGDCGLLFSSFKLPNNDIPKSSRTLTQRFLGMLIREFSWSQELLALVVSMDDLNLLDETNFAGNSLSLVQAQSKRWQQVSEQTAANWRSFLQVRAARAIEVHEVAVTVQPHLVLSSLGDIERYSWCPKLSEASFRMYPTPNDHVSANLAVWSFGDTHAVSLAASKDHALYRDFHKIAKIWSELFYVQ